MLSSRRVDLAAFGRAVDAALGARTQAWLAQAVNLHPAAVSKWVGGKAEPEIDTVFAIERVLCVPPGELMRHLGYVPVTTAEISSVIAAIETDNKLDSRTQRALISVYLSFTESDVSSST